MDNLVRERAEAEVAISERGPEDPISIVVGSALYSVHHRFPDLHMDLPSSSAMRGGGLHVSRFYFNVKVVVDIIEHPERVGREIAAKRAYCARKGLRYVLVSTNFDDEGVRSQLAPVRLPASKPRTTASRPVSKPRTRKTL
jgi:hypothetical protein